MSERFVISGGGVPSILLPADTTRLQAAQAFEADCKLFDPATKSKDLRGNQAFRVFVEGSQNQIRWLTKRIDAVTEH